MVFSKLFGQKPKIDIQSIYQNIDLVIEYCIGSTAMYESLKGIEVKKDLNYERVLIAFTFGLVDVYSAINGVRELSQAEQDKHEIDMTKFCIIQIRKKMIKHSHQQNNNLSETELSAAIEQIPSFQKILDGNMEWFIKTYKEIKFRDISNTGFEYGKEFNNLGGNVMGTKLAFVFPKMLAEEKVVL